jgi:hypothetical protein
MTLLRKPLPSYPHSPLGTLKKLLLELCSKLLGKGKKTKKQKKLVSTVATTAFETKIKGGFVKTPQHQ